MRQMLENGFFHADPHAGNLLALPNGKLCYLDFGMVSLLGRKGYIFIWSTVLLNRYSGRAACDRLPG